MRTLLCLLLIASTGVLSGCGSSIRAETGAVQTAAQAEDCLPRKVALILDKSLSAPETRTPQLRLEDVEALLEALVPCGGELAVGLIHDRTREGFATLRIEPVPAIPEARTTRSSIRRRREAAKLQRDRAELVEAWQEAMTPSLDAFRSSAETLLSHPVNAQHSPVWDAIHRSDVFLAQTEVGWAQDASRIIVLVSDCIDDTGRRPVTLASKATVMVVNGAGTIGSLASLQPQRFTQFDAVIRSFQDAQNKPAPSKGAAQ